MPRKGIAKPKKHVSEPYWDYHEVAHFINKKYKVDIDNFAGHKYTGKKNDMPYQNFWHWICDFNEIHNGSYFELDLVDGIADEVEDEKCGTPAWVKEILKMFLDEFEEEVMYFRAVW
jgi:hypothetical protein